MTSPISGSSSGRSPDASAIYSQYLVYYQDINNQITTLNNEIHTIDMLPYAQRTSAASNQQKILYQNQISALQTLQKSLSSIYQTQYNSSSATLASFIAAYQAAAQAGSGTSNLTQQIQAAYTSAESIAAALNQRLSADQSALSNLSVEAATLSDAINNPSTGLLVQYNSLSDDNPMKAGIKNDLNAANVALATLNSDIQASSNQLTELQATYNAIMATGSGFLAQLHNLSTNPNPTASTLTSATSILSTIQKAQSDELTLQAAISKSSGDVVSVNNALTVVKDDFSPSAQIEASSQMASSILTGLQAQIAKDQSFLTSLLGQVPALTNTITGLSDTISSLKTTIANSSLSSTAQAAALKDLSQAIQDLTTAQQALTTLTSTTIPGAQNQINNLNAQLNAITNSSKTGYYDQLLALVGSHSTDVTTASQLLNQIRLIAGQAQGTEQTLVQPMLSTIVSNLSSLNNQVNSLLPSDIAAINTDLNVDAPKTTYDQYVSYYNAINDDITQINLKYPAPQPAAVRAAIIQLVSLQQKISTAYYAAPTAPIATFQATCAPYQSQIAAAFSQGMNGGLSIQQQIQSTYANAQSALSALQDQLASDVDGLSNLNNPDSLVSQAALLQSQIATLTAEVNNPSIPSAQQTMALSDLASAQNALTKLLQVDIPAAQQQIALLNQTISTLVAPGGILTQLQALSTRTNPPLSQTDLTNATNLLNSIQQAQSSEQTYRNTILLQATNDIAGVQALMAQVQKDMDPTQQIQSAFAQAQKDLTAMQSQMAQYTTSYNNLTAQAASLQTTINSLQNLIGTITDPTKKQQALASLQAAQAAYNTLTQTDIPAIEAQLATLSSQISALTTGQSPYNQLQALSNKTSPTWNDSLSASTLLASFDQAENSINTSVLQTAFQKATSDISSINLAINSIQTATPYKIENGAWYITWVGNDTPVPQGVTTVNLFEGAISQDANGNYILSPFAGYNLAAVQNFIAKCHANNPPITVNISLGGAGGQSVYNDTWDQLNSTNVVKMGTDLANYCKLIGADGIDFDYEEFKSTDQAALVGSLIKAFKTADPTLQTSLDTNAGFGPNFPWQNYMQTILDAASTTDPTTGKKTCAVDYFNIMSYGVYLGNIGSLTPLQAEAQWIAGPPLNNQWIQNPDGSYNWQAMYPNGPTGGWASWLQSSYGFTPAQLGVGIDAYDNLINGQPPIDVKQFAEFAKNFGFSTEYWAYDPRTTPSTAPTGTSSGSAYSNQETNTIYGVYNSDYTPPV